MKELRYDPKMVHEVLKRERELRCQKVGLTMKIIQKMEKKMTTNEKRH